MLVTLTKYKTCSASMPSVSFVSMNTSDAILRLLVAPVIASLCRNPNGFMWAGDTAQTIAVESVFTFEQLGALLYRCFVRGVLSVTATEPELTAFSQNSTSSAPHRPERYQLLVNYRSHGGIVKCANAIIDLLRKFPGAIDVLRPEAVAIGRELPVFFHGAMLPSNIRDFFSIQP